MYDIAPIESPAGTLRTGQLLPMILFSYITLIIWRVNTSLPPPTALWVTTSTFLGTPSAPPPPEPADPPGPECPHAAAAASVAAAAAVARIFLVRIMVWVLPGRQWPS